MLSVLVLLGMSTAAFAQWQEGDFSAELSWQGSVTQSRNPWMWAQGSLSAPVDLDVTQAYRAGDLLQWRDLLVQTPLLLGKTERLVPQGRPGIMPVIDYGHGVSGISVVWADNGEARVTMPINGGDGESQQGGTLTFSLRVNAALVSTQEGVRHSHNAVAGGDSPGNGMPPARVAQPTALAIPALRALFGAHAPSWLATEVPVGKALPMTALSQAQHQAIGGVYGAEIMAGSGVLSVAVGQVPSRWQVSLPIQITYL
ncbi:hypothetical protein [Aeromonas sp. Y318-1]|uniref:F4 family fimbrial subunit n=1 Tax=Aeromonas TaxID=642 RepID=UPI0022DF1096|nr:hypothetical protein [Aeromonas sp. Y318-1]